MVKRILILDDDTDILTICVFILEDLGWEVHTRTNCINILDTVSEVQPSVILMDNWIPETGGVVATRLIKGHNNFKNIPVIYFSANHDIKNLSEQAGADTYLEKPFDISHFEKKINYYLKN